MKFAVEIKGSNETDNWRRYKIYDSKLSAVLHSFKDRLFANFCLWAQGRKWHIDCRIVEIKEGELEWPEQK